MNKSRIEKHSDEKYGWICNPISSFSAFFTSSEAAERKDF